MAGGQVSYLAPQSICVRYGGDGVCRVSCDPPLTSALAGRPGAPGSGLELRADRCPVRLERGARGVREAGADGDLEGLGVPGLTTVYFHLQSLVGGLVLLSVGMVTTHPDRGRGRSRAGLDP